MKASINVVGNFPCSWRATVPMELRRPFQSFKILTFFLPPNTTFKLQPFAAGSVSPPEFPFETYQIENSPHLLEEGTTFDIYKLNILSAINVLNRVCSGTDSHVLHFWKHIELFCSSGTVGDVSCYDERALLIAFIQDPGLVFLMLNIKFGLNSNDKDSCISETSGKILID